MREDRRPYYIKKIYLKFRYWYTEHFMAPKCDYLGPHHTFMKPWFTSISGSNIRIGKCSTIISEPDQRTRIAVWGLEPGEGKINIGDCVLVSPGCRISACHEISIGDSTMLANGVYITDSDWHGIYDRVERPKEPTPVIVGKNVWLGDNCTILKGVAIGDNSIVASKAVVTKDIPANVIVAGNPAKIVKELDAEHEFHTRSDYYSDPVALDAFFDKVDYMVLKDNRLFNWLRALVWPTRKD